MAGISIVIPTVNEADNIDPLFERIFAAGLPENISLEVVVVDDSSTDETRSRVRRWSKLKPVSLVCRENRDGLANAVVAGAKAAAYDHILVMDADLSHPPEKIADMIQPLLAGSCDMVIGSRYVEGGATPQWPATRKIASRLASLPACIFTDVKDPMAGFFATSKQRLSALRSDIPGFKIGFELLAQGGEQLSVREIPIVFHDRFEGFSKMNKKVIFDYFMQVVQLSGIQTRLFTPARLLVLVVLGVLIDNLFYTVLTKAYYNPVVSHICALTLGCSLIYYALFRFWKGTDAARNIRPLQLLLGLLSLVGGVSLQGGLFQLFSAMIIFNDASAFFAASLISVTLFVGLMVIFAFSGYEELENSVRLRIAAVGLACFSILLRLVYLGLPELMEQEAYYWNYSNHFALSYLDHPPMAATLIWIGTTIFGTNEFAVRIASFFCWFVTAYFCCRLASEVFGRSAAIGVLALVAWLPFYFGAGMIMTPDAPLLASWSALLYFLYRALIEGDGRAWYGVGVSLGLGMISKYTIVLLGPAILCFMLFDRKSRAWFLRPAPYRAVLIALIIFLPVIVWNFQHEWASFLFQGERRVSGKMFFTTHRLAGYILLILTPAGVIGLFYFLFRGNRFFNGAADNDNLYNSRAGINRTYGFLLLMIVFPLLVFLSFSFTREVKLNWTAPLWLALLPFLGCTLMMGASGYAENSILRLIKRLWMPTILTIALGFSIAMHYVTLGLPGIPHPPGPFLTGWGALSQDIEEIVNQVEQETGNRPVVIGMNPYQISSGLAFYRTKNLRDESIEDRARGIEETLGWHLFGWNALMYGYWAQPEDFRGRNIIVVASSRIRAESPYFQKRVKGEDPIFMIHARKEGQEVSRFFIRKLYDYRPRPFRKKSGSQG
jgi:dolichol-phosphate mannosyltransferase